MVTRAPTSQFTRCLDRPVVLTSSSGVSSVFAGPSCGGGAWGAGELGCPSPAGLSGAGAPGTPGSERLALPVLPAFETSWPSRSLSVLQLFDLALQALGQLFRVGARHGLGRPGRGSAPPSQFALPGLGDGGMPHPGPQQETGDVMPSTAEFILNRLTEWGIRRVYGYPGDGIDSILGAFHKVGDRLDFIQCRHEEIAAFAACAHAKFTGEVGVCMATSGPGAIHLLNGLVRRQARSSAGGGDRGPAAAHGHRRQLPAGGRSGRPL